MVRLEFIERKLIGKSQNNNRLLNNEVVVTTALRNKSAIVIFIFRSVSAEDGVRAKVQKQQATWDIYKGVTL